jgi:cytochrome P450
LLESTEHGEIDLATVNLFDHTLMENPYDFYRLLRQRAPVWRVPETRVFAVANWDLVTEATSRVEDFSSNLTGALVRDANGRPTVLEFPPGSVSDSAIATADPPEHGLHRRLSLAPVSATAIAKLEPAITAAVDRLWAPMLKQGGGEAINGLALQIPGLVVTWLLGLPEDQADRLARWGVSGGDLFHGTFEAKEIAESLSEIATETAYLDERVQAAIDQGDGAGMVGQLAKTVADGVIDAKTARGILLTMVGAAVETTLSLIGNTILLMVETPGLQAHLRKNLDDIPALIEESARLESPFKFHYRLVRRSCRLGQVDLVPGDRLQLLWGSANRDETAIDDADRLDLTRRNPRKHLAFGHGIHFCIGSALARQETRIVLERLLTQTKDIALGKRGAVRLASIFVRRLETLDLRFTV